MNYEELGKAFKDNGIDLRIEECHAILCACMCISPTRDDFAQISASLGSIGDKKIDIDKMAVILEALAPIVVANIEDENLKFELLLPDEDDFDLPSRVQAFVRWCDAFLIGLSLSTPLERLSETKLSGDSREFLHDLSKFVDLIGVENIEEDNYSEQDLYHLTEFTRIHVIGLFLDLRREEPPPAGSVPEAPASDPSPSTHH